MSIWMEDQSSKKQWFKDGMVKDDYVSTANAIPDASAADYVECFRDTLDSDLVDSSDAMRKLLDGKIKARRGGVYNVGGIVNTIAGSSQNV
ncbi:hypothetical protein PC123_g11757 [Phytophthora cactorum]|nr:hypothetical protein PC123_g11757 [Phytophthora cactorum]